LNSATPIDSDIQLWNEFRSGSKSSFEKLVQVHYRSLYAYGTKFRRDHEFVKDCLQDLFLQLWKNRSTLGNTGHVKSYLFKCVRNNILRAIQKNKWHSQTVQLDDNYAFDVEFSIEHHLIREQTLRDTASRFSKLLNTLPRRQKEIIYLRFYQDLEIDEIVTIMEINAQSIYNLIHKALSSLHERLSSNDSLLR
jgi:RNA polymerase sigma factor (sigma-70 family)